MRLHLLVSGLLLASIKPIHEIEIEDVIAASPHRSVTGQRKRGFRPFFVFR